MSSDPVIPNIGEIIARSGSSGGQILAVAAVLPVATWEELTEHLRRVDPERNEDQATQERTLEQRIALFVQREVEEWISHWRYTRSPEWESDLDDDVPF